MSMAGHHPEGLGCVVEVDFATELLQRKITHYLTHIWLKISQHLLGNSDYEE